MDDIACPSTTSSKARQDESGAWCALSVECVLQQLDTDRAGLSDREANRRQESYGLNALPTAPAVRLWQIVARQFMSPMVYILAVASLLSLWIGHHSDAGFIAGVLVLNAIIGAIQEQKAEHSSRALQKLLRMTTAVSRGGEVRNIDCQELVPGDIVLMESGDRVPADLRLVEARGLEIDESLLTGESMSVGKNTAWFGKADTPTSDQENMAWAGTAVTLGRAQGIVVATGSSTSIGQLASDVVQIEGGVPPLLSRLRRFTQRLGVLVLLAAILIAVLGVLAQGRDVPTMAIFAVALVVSVIPEGLPVCITVALSIATTRMARKGVIVRRLGSVEGLGSCTYIATDKTGTLTCNEMSVSEIRQADGSAYSVDGVGFAPNGQVTFGNTPVDLGKHPGLYTLVAGAALCNEGELRRTHDEWTWRGDPTDVALLSMSLKLGIAREALLDRQPQVTSIPFEPERQFSASFHRASELGDRGEHAVQVFVKGAPEVILRACALSPQEHARQNETTAEMARQGLRVLAIAHHPSVNMSTASDGQLPQNLELLGFVGMIDPLRPGVQDAIRSCTETGIRVCMVTGDHPETAAAIGRSLGMCNGDTHHGVVLGADVEAAGDDELDRLVGTASIFARVTPHHKLRIVESAQRLGHFVAVTGDGVNDAPALRQANIGVAMGLRGTDIARQAADLIISDDNFTTIVAGIEEGRVVYDNIRKVIQLLVSTGVAEMVLVVMSVLFGMPLPLLPVQLLWLNLVTNGIQDVALAFEPGEPGILRRAPRPSQEPIFNRLMIHRVVVSAATMGSVGFGAFAWMLHMGWPLEQAQNAVLLLWVLFENVHIANCRSETRSAFASPPWASPVLMAGVLTAFLIHLLAMYWPPMQALLHTQPVPLHQWAVLALLATTVLCAVEIHKQLRRGLNRIAQDA
ncbi:HAD-IC family P-type ATPase [Phycisphaeraceae bacterium D3-23]